MRSPSMARVGAPLPAVPAAAARERHPGGARSVEGLRMSPDPFEHSPFDDRTFDHRTFVHEPVMVDAVVALFGPVPAGVIVDATVGGGGHAAAILAARADVSLVGVDRGPLPLEAAAPRPHEFGDPVTFPAARVDAP